MQHQPGPNFRRRSELQPLRIRHSLFSIIPSSSLSFELLPIHYCSSSFPRDDENDDDDVCSFFSLSKKAVLFANNRLKFPLFCPPRFRENK